MAETRKRASRPKKPVAQASFDFPGMRGAIIVHTEEPFYVTAELVKGQKELVGMALRADAGALGGFSQVLAHPSLKEPLLNLIDTVREMVAQATGLAPAPPRFPDRERDPEFWAKRNECFAKAGKAVKDAVTARLAGEGFKDADELSAFQQATGQEALEDAFEAAGLTREGWKPEEKAV